MSVGIQRGSTPCPRDTLRVSLSKGVTSTVAFANPCPEPVEGQSSAWLRQVQSTRFSQQIAAPVQAMPQSYGVAQIFNLRGNLKDCPTKNAVGFDKCNLRQPAGPKSARTGRQKTQSARHPPDPPPGRSLLPGKAEPRQIKALQKTVRQLTD